jgi:hypothetical protein
MARRSDTPLAGLRAPSKRLAAVGRAGRRIARKLAQTTLLTAGLAASQFSLPEIDSRFPMFNPHLVDRLQSPITRHHE